MTERPTAVPLAAVVVVVLLVVAGAAGMTLSYLTDRADEAWWHAATAGAALAVYLAPFARTLPLRALLPWAVVAWLVLLIATTLATGLGFLSVQGWHWGLTGVSIWYANPNLLGTAVGAVCVACLVLLRRRPWPLAFVLISGSVAAMAFAGSRTALLAFAAALLTWVLVDRRAWLPVGAAALVAAGLVALTWATRTPPASPNLLTSSHAFHRSHWVKGGSAVMVQPAWNPGRTAPADGVRVVREASEGGVNVVRHTGIVVPEDAASMVGSIFARADEPTVFELALANVSVRCEVGSAWTRCETPAAQAGNTTLSIRTTEPGAALDVHLWGAQVEVGEVAGPVVVRRPPLLPWVQVRALDPARLFSGNDAGRGEAWADAARLVAERPLAGYGIAGATPTMRASGGSRHQHAHMGPLQVALEHGLVVSAVWAAAFGVAAIAMLRRSGARMLPFVVVVVALNAFDAMTFVDGPFLGWWFVAAYGATAPPRARREGHGRYDRRFRGRGVDEDGGMPGTTVGGSNGGALHVRLRSAPPRSAAKVDRC